MIISEGRLGRDLKKVLCKATNIKTLIRFLKKYFFLYLNKIRLMKIKFTYTFLGSLFLAFLFMSNSNGRADGNNWGNTGAPGDEMSNGQPRTCMTCHNSGTAFQVTLDIEILSTATGLAVTTYVPGEFYTCRVTINDIPGTGAPTGYGFQIVNLYDSDNSDVNLLANPDPNVKLAFADNTGNWYAEHNGISTSNEFRLMWVGPPAGSGPVTFYSCGNGVNGNGMSGGDAAACNTLTLTEDGIIATNEFEDENTLSVFPNPVNDLLNIESKLPVAGNYAIRIFNQLGQLVTAENRMIQQNEIFQIDASQLPTGVYSILLENEEVKVAKRFLKN